MDRPLKNFTAAKFQSSEILKLVERAEKLAITLQKQSPEYILCHADIHGWNLMIDKEGALYIVDWDTLIFAPKERDLMFIGADIWNSGRTASEEARVALMQRSVIKEFIRQGRRH